jgi:hypothetical protein
MPGPGGTVVADPHFQKQYSHFCYPLQYLAGKTTYLDTPVLPTGAFTGNGTFPVDAELPTQTPVIASAMGQVAGAPGPYIVDNGPVDNASRTIVIASAANLTTNGLTDVPNPAFGSPGEPKLITRDYGFGASGTVRLGGQDIPAANVTWGNKQLTVIVPSGMRTGELQVVRGSGASARTSTLGVTLSVATPQMHAARPPKVVAAGAKIQPVIDGATRATSSWSTRHLRGNGGHDEAGAPAGRRRSRQRSTSSPPPPRTSRPGSTRWATCSSRLRPTSCPISRP